MARMVFVQAPGEVMKKLVLSCMVVLMRLSVTEAQGVKSALEMSGYLETYYSYDFNRPEDNVRPSFLYNHNRSNEVSVNLAFLRAAYKSENVRANLALAAGTYMQANYASEPGGFKNCYEATIGVKIAQNSNLWLDAGIMPSHIGWESAVGKENATLSRSMAAENSPYFESGIKMGYTSKNEKWYLAVLYLNGWQRIQRLEGNTTPCGGTQLTFKPDSRLTFNYSTFIGNDKPDSLRRMRYYNNFYGVAQVTSKLDMTLGMDVGFEQKTKGGDGYAVWYSPVIILRYHLDKRVRVAMRGEYFNDRSGAVIPVNGSQGFQVFGYSINADYVIMSNLMARIEARNFESRGPVFRKRGDSTANNNRVITTVLAWSF